jgi:hypothetical protein
MLQETTQAMAVAKVSELSEVAAMIQDFSIDTQDEMGFALDAVREIKAEAKKLDAQMRSATDPMRAAIEEVRGWFKPAIDLCGKIENAWKRKIVEAEAAVADARRALEIEAYDAQEAGDKETAIATIIQASNTTVDLVGASKREIWKFEVVDPALVPREFLIVDEVAIGRAVRSSKGSIVIPGVRNFKETSLAVGGV